MLTKNETNNAIITKLCNVREHPNADRLKLATVLGTQVIVGLDAQDGDLVIYFDSNLRLSPVYLQHNNLYSSKEMNANSEVKGYFGKNGRVRAQKFRGEMSNGYVAEFSSFNFLVNNENRVHPLFDIKEGDEFTHINGVEICSKYIVQNENGYGGFKTRHETKSNMFHKHWDTKQLMRELDSIPEDSVLYIEEKEHGTSGRTGNVLCNTNRSWWKFWAPKQEWKVVSGTRRVDNIVYHIPQVREEIERRVAPYLYKGENIFYEICGYDVDGAPIQSGFSYGCRPGEFRVMLYRVTITTLDGYSYDLSRQQVYKRAEELGLEKPLLLRKIKNAVAWPKDVINNIIGCAVGKSGIDNKTIKEGIVVWFEDSNGNWTCLKHKSEEFLLDQDKRVEKEEGDVEDVL